MAIAIVSHVAASGSTTYTTASIDTSGATLLVANNSNFNGTPQLSDSKGNTWVPFTSLVASGTANTEQLWYCINPVVGTGHTFTITAGNAGTLEVAAFSGITSVLAFNKTSSATAASSSTIQPGSVTPDQASSLIICGVGFQNAGPTLSSIDSGFTITDTKPASGVYGGSLAYLIQNSASAVNPTWTFSGGLNAATRIAVFIGGSATPPATPAIVASVSRTNSGTTAGINTTGAKLLVAVQSNFGSTFGTVTDSNGNTWVSLTIAGSAGTAVRLHYVVNPTVGAAHTFTLTGNNLGTFHVAAFDTVDTVSPYDTDNRDLTAASVTGQGTAITPANDGSLIICGIGLQNSGTPHILGVDLGFKITTFINPGASLIGGALAYITQTTAAAINPTWTTDAGEIWAIAKVVFKIASSGLTVTGNDTLSLSDSLNIVTPILGSTFNDTLSLSDALAQNIGFALRNSDTLSLSDAIASTLGMIISDSFTLSDLLRYGLSLPITIVGDSLSLSDAIVYLIGVAFGKSDALSFSDVLKLGASVSRSLGDNILLSDFLAALITQLPSYSDTFGLSDSTRLTLSLGLSQNDSLVLLDAVKIAIVNNLILNQADSLSLSDSVEFDLSSNLDQYIRHYLNDVLR